MEEIGKEYFYQTKGGTVKKGRLVSQTPAWNCFDNGDWVERYSPLYESKEMLEEINKLVHAMYVTTYVPEVLHVPNRFLK